MSLFRFRFELVLTRPLSLYAPFSFCASVNTVQIRVTLYLYWALGEDEESQRKGHVGVVCWPSNQEAVSPDKFTVVYSPREVHRHIHLSNRMFECSPTRIAGIHMCLPDEPIFHMMRTGLALSLGKLGSRLKIHCGKSSSKYSREKLNP